VAGNGADGVVGAAEDAGPSTGVAASVLLSSLASPIVAATSIGVPSRRVNSHTSAKIKETSWGTVSDVNCEASIASSKMNKNSWGMPLDTKMPTQNIDVTLIRTDPCQGTAHHLKHVKISHR